MKKTVQKSRETVPLKAKRKNQKRNEAKRKLFGSEKAKIRCIYFALVGSEKFEAKRSEMKRKNKKFFSRERAKRMRNGSRFASFRFEAKKILKRNRRTLLMTARYGAYIVQSL